ncbi:hypothetical protein [Caryophanon latum]|uniref:Uncharacterized protein n=1 Tax=Caryophanon latum TaxID=33977 RepID=A0A1C0YWR7_9BACL|nr:hypothetical protein [Caryophanon latum]OCS91550.1 hypothetical protein A6K76_08535 [Caryophanon latum]
MRRINRKFALSAAAIVLMGGWSMKDEEKAVEVVQQAHASNAVDVTDFAFVEFSGANGDGIAGYTFDHEQFMQRVFNYAADSPADEATMEEMMKVDSAIRVYLDEQENLKNGDIITLIVEVDETKTDKIKDAERTFQVKGLVE